MNGSVVIAVLLGLMQALILWLLNVIFERQKADALAAKERQADTEKKQGEQGERIARVESEVAGVNHRVDLSGEQYASLVARMDTIHRDMVTKGDLMMLVEIIKSGAYVKS